MIKVYTEQDLIEFLGKLTSVTRAVIQVRTELIMRRTDVRTKQHRNPFPTVFKIQLTEVDLNVHYEDKVNDGRLFENKKQDFESEGLPYGEVLCNSILVKDGRKYLRTMPIVNLGETVYQDTNGRVLSKEVLEPFIPPKYEPKSQGLKQTVVVRNYKLENVLSLTIPGKFMFTRVQ